ncbi:MAG TPA: hypothetical protein VIJ29_00405 [Candidatus Paceibacterota bacterium]
MKIEWNKVTWYSKLIALALFVALPFIGFYYGVQYGKIAASVGQTPVISAAATSTIGGTGTSYYSDPAEWQIDANNTTAGFSIAYPLDFDTQDNYSATPSTDWRLDTNAPGIKYFMLTVPRAFEPQTNFAGATLTVGASGNDAAVSDCMDLGEGVITSTTTINGTSFNVFMWFDEGAGNEYAITSYRTLHAGKCYVIEYSLHSSQIGNYPTSYDLQPFSEQQINSVMQNIVSTFKFM